MATWLPSNPTKIQASDSGQLAPIHQGIWPYASLAQEELRVAGDRAQGVHGGAIFGGFSSSSKIIYVIIQGDVWSTTKPFKIGLHMCRSIEKCALLSKHTSV